MIRVFTKQLLSITQSFLLVIALTPFEAQAQQWAQTGSTGYSGQGAPHRAIRDALVAQILGAATFPDQVAVADNWLQQNNVSRARQRV